MDNKTRGTVTVSKRALMQLIWFIAKNCEGVAEVTDPKNKKKIKFFKKDEPDGVYITGTKKGIFADVCIILKYGADSQEIRNIITEKVKRVSSETGIKIDEVNVRIEGIAE